VRACPLNGGLKVVVKATDNFSFLRFTVNVCLQFITKVLYIRRSSFVCIEKFSPNWFYLTLLVALGFTAY